MADVSLTAANIRPLTENGAVLRQYTAGGTITIGDAVYVAADGDVERADGSAQNTARAIGIAVQSYDGETTISAGDPVTVCVFGPVAGFSGLAEGTPHYVSDEAGKIADGDDGTWTRVLGYPEREDVFFVNPHMEDPAS